MSWYLKLAELESATQGQKLSQVRTDFSGMGTDTRVDLSGKLFIALKGDVYDAHDFVAKAVSQGAAGVLIHEWRDEWKPLLSKSTFIRVGDTLKGLQELGLFWRRKHRFAVVGISGSNGKTSTKEFTAAMLKKLIPAYASKGSFNNHWGVPLSILQAGPEHTVLILEMGMNHEGELARLTQIAEPNVVVVTMVGRSHIGELGSQEAIARAKSEMYLTTPKAVHIFNLDNPWTEKMWQNSLSQGHQQGRYTFSETRSEADVQFQVMGQSMKGLDLKIRIKQATCSMTVQVFGRHNVVNLMAAASIGLSLGLKPEQIFMGLGEISDAAWGRNQFVKLSMGATVLFDAYNANPDSMDAMLNNFSDLAMSGAIKDQGKKYLVLGDMLELGAISDEAHFEIGVKAAKLSPAGVLCQGQFCQQVRKGLESQNFSGIFVEMPEYNEAVAKKFAASFQKNDLIAIKGSRGMKLERILKAWNPLAFAEK